jgi:hypothetical protein
VTALLNLQSSLEEGTIVISEARITPIEPHRGLSIFTEHVPSPSSIPQVLRDGLSPSQL